MRWWIVFCLILALPLAYAPPDNWYFAGESWEEEGVVYSVEGSDQHSVLLGVGGQLILIGEYDCKEVGYTEYCYTQTAYPDDEDHIKYEGGEKLYGYYLTFNEYAPDLEVTRTVEDTVVDISETINVEILFENKGDYGIQGITYRVPIPEGLKIISGPKKGQMIEFSLISLPVSQRHKFTYSLLPEQFGTFLLEPNTSFQFEDETFYLDTDNVELTVSSPLEVKTYASPLLEIDEKGHYEANITNVEDGTVSVDISLEIPEGVEMENIEGINDKSYRKTIDLLDDETHTVSFDFYTGDQGIIIPMNVTFTYGEYTSPVILFTSSTNVNKYLITPEIKISPTLETYQGGSEINVSVVLENTNDKIRFKNVLGSLESSLWGKALYGHQTFGPAKTLTEVQKQVILPPEGGTFTFTLDGTYESPRGIEYTISDQRTIKVIPVERSVEVTRTITPLEAERGQNISVQVSGKNNHGKYASIEVREEFPEGFVRSSGLSQIELSLDRGENSVFYRYDLFIPEDYSQNTFTIRTITRIPVEGITETTSTEITLPEWAEVEISDSELNQTDDDANIIQDDLEKPGIFTRMWRFVKGLFS